MQQYRNFGVEREKEGSKSLFCTTGRRDDDAAFNEAYCSCLPQFAVLAW